jgi:hypothetical protein
LSKTFRAHQRRNGNPKLTLATAARRAALLRTIDEGAISHDAHWQYRAETRFASCENTAAVTLAKAGR